MSEGVMCLEKIKFPEENCVRRRIVSGELCPEENCVRRIIVSGGEMRLQEIKFPENKCV